MKSNLINRRKKAVTPVSPQTIQRAVQEAEGILLIMQSTGDARTRQMQEAVTWLKNVAGNPAMRNQLDDRAYPQFAQTAQQYITWINRMRNSPEFQTDVELDGLPPHAVVSSGKQGAGSAQENFVTDRNEEGEAKMPEKAEVPRLAYGETLYCTKCHADVVTMKKQGMETCPRCGKVLWTSPSAQAPFRSASKNKVAQPAPGAAPAPPAPGAGAPPPAAPPAMAPGAPQAPVPPPAPKVTPSGQGDAAADITQMSSEALQLGIQALADVKELTNDKATLDLINLMTKTLAGRPVEAPPLEGAGKRSSVKTALGLYDGSSNLGKTLPDDGYADGGEPYTDEEMGTINSGPGKCDQCDSANINGVYCHERGCPNERKTWDPELREWVQETECPECGNRTRGGERCNCMEPTNEGPEMRNFCFGGLNTASAEKVAVAPPGAEHAVKEMKKDEDIDNPFALAWYMKDKGDTFKEGAYKEAQAAMHGEMDKLAAGATGGSWVHDQVTGDLEEGKIPEVGEANKLEDEGPAKLERPETTLPIKLNENNKTATEKKRDASTALKKVETLADRLKEMYLDAKDITTVNDSRHVREAVEAIFLAYDLLGQAAKVLGKQQMQEEAEEEALKVKEKGKKKSGLLDGLVLAGEDMERCEECGKELSGSESEFCKQCERKRNRGEAPKKPSKKDW